MHRGASTRWISLFGILCCAGCGGAEVSVIRFIDPLGLLPTQSPIRIGINRVHLPLPPLFKPAPWQPLQNALWKTLDQPVQFEALKPFQMREHLREGRLEFALVDAADYAELASEPAIELVAIGVNPCRQSIRLPT